MLNEDSFQFAIENTEVIQAPERRIATFGSTSFRFHLVTELMDDAHAVKVRDGILHAERPQLITPGHLRRAALEGFGERAEEFIDWLEQFHSQMAVMKYGFQFRKTNMSETIVRQPVEAVLAKIREEVDRQEDALSAIIRGVDEGWEVCLLKFATDLIQESAGENLGDFRRRGLL